MPNVLRVVYGTQRVRHCIPTQRVGTRANLGSDALRGNES